MVCGQLHIVNSFHVLHGRLECCCGLLCLMRLCLDPATAHIACIACYSYLGVNSHWSCVCSGYGKGTIKCMYAHAFDTISRCFLPHTHTHSVFGQAAWVDASLQDGSTPCLTQLSAMPLHCPVYHVGRFLSPHPPLLARAFGSNSNRCAQ